jgi:hypothetical protein
MANLGQTFDANSIEPSQPFELLPAGKYLMQIVNSEMRGTKSGDGQYLWMELDVIDGPHAGKKQWERLNLVNNNSQAVEISQRTLSAICRAVGKMTVSDSEMLHFQPMTVTVKVKPAGPDKQGVYREAQNLIGGYESVGGTTVQTTHRPAITSAPTATAKPAAATPPWRRTA